MIYVLVLLWGGITPQTGFTSSAIEFNSLAACEKARDQISAAKGRVWATHFAACYPKGEPRK